MGGGEDVRSDNFVQQPGELRVGEIDAVELLELVAEVGFQRGSVADVVAIGVLELREPGEQLVFELALGRCH